MKREKEARELRLEEEPPVLQPRVQREDPVVDRLHGDARRQGAGVEHIETCLPEDGVPGTPVSEPVKRSSGLKADEKPKRVARCSCISQSPYAPLGPNSFVVGIHHIEAPYDGLRSSWVALMPRALELLLSIALYQRPAVTSPCAQMP